jgi:hypothetical protein
MKKLTFDYTVLIDCWSLARHRFICEGEGEGEAVIDQKLKLISSFYNNLAPKFLQEPARYGHVLIASALGLDNNLQNPYDVHSDPWGRAMDVSLRRVLKKFLKHDYVLNMHGTANDMNWLTPDPERFQYKNVLVCGLEATGCVVDRPFGLREMFLLNKANVYSGPDYTSNTNIRFTTEHFLEPWFTEYPDKDFTGGPTRKNLTIMWQATEEEKLFKLKSLEIR